MKHVCILLGMVVLLLAGCGSQLEAAPSPMETSTHTPEQIAPLGAAETPVREPTRTPYLSPTPTITPTPYPTSTPQPLIFPTPENAKGRYPESYSPSEKWSAWRVDCTNQDSVSSDCFAFVNKDGTKFWPLEVEVPLIEDGLKDVYVSVTHWSKDNRFVYLVSYPMDVEWYFGHPAHSLIKFSLVNGTHSYIITPQDHPAVSNWYLLFEYSFSSDSQRLAYARKNERSIDFVLLNLYSGEVDFFSEIVEEETAFGDIAWSPNDRFFVFNVAENLSGIFSANDFSVILVDTEELYTKRIYPHGDGWLFSPEWISNREVRYESVDSDGFGKLVLDIETGEVTGVQ